MCTNEYIYFAICQFSDGLLLLLRGLKTIDVVHIAWEVFQSFNKGFIMLEGQDGGRYQQGHLLTVSHRFKCCTDGYFRFTKAHISAYQTIHRKVSFHVFLYIYGSLQLIRRVFIKKWSLKLGLKIGIRCKRKTAWSLSLSIKFYEVLGNILDPVLGFRFQIIPGIGAQFIQLRDIPFLACIFCDPVQRVDTYIQKVIIFINKPNGLLLLALIIDLFESVETPDAMIDMGDIITLFQVMKFFQG